MKDAKMGAKKNAKIQNGNVFVLKTLKLVLTLLKTAPALLKLNLPNTGFYTAIFHPRKWKLLHRKYMVEWTQIYGVQDWIFM